MYIQLYIHMCWATCCYFFFIKIFLVYAWFSVGFSQPLPVQHSQQTATKYAYF